MKALIDYIITWLCYGNEEAAHRVAYSADTQLLSKYDVLIIPNGHMGKDIVLPDMQKAVVNQVAKGKYVIYTDIVYATFFFASRAEEIIHKDRDEHDRFLARHSILGRGNRLLIPLLDEYARVLMKCLELPLPSPGFSQIYLTHDIDALTQYRSLRGTLGGLLRGEWRQVVRAWKDIHHDPLYTFPWLVEQDRQVADAQAIYFIKMAFGHGYDYPQYRLRGRDFQQLNKWLLSQGAFTGIHNSYYDLAQRIIPDKTAAHPVVFQRCHYLRCPIPKMRSLCELGYTDDFTMGFADRAGFRLQTTRPIRWIAPESWTLTGLTLHPLMIMDTTLSEEKYMHLTEDEAYFLCEQIIDKVRMHHGELNLLWHNSNINAQSYHKSLYPKVLAMLK